jgi:hypothetical protein
LYRYPGFAIAPGVYRIDEGQGHEIAHPDQAEESTEKQFVAEGELAQGIGLQRCRFVHGGLLPRGSVQAENLTLI